MMKNRSAVLLGLALTVTLSACTKPAGPEDSRGLMKGESPPAGSELSYGGQIAEAKPEWFACKVDSDCEPQKGVCDAWQAINKTSMNDYRAYMDKMAERFTCTEIAHEETPRVACQQQRCTVQPSESNRPGEVTTNEPVMPPASQGQGND